ncbi:transglutaminaseTgpA domain-containing protein [Aeromonas enteropelogenes]|uniref:transglutaminase family protein n=1 Tax=Aeromonas enteropelogenes TaxID=29489 RepID=UPI003F74827F
MLLDNRRLLPLIALQQLLLAAALWPQLQLWVLAVGAATLGVRAMMLWRGWHPPPTRLLALLAGIGILLLVWQWRALGTLPALINLLWLGYSLKMIEVRRERDIEQVLLIAFFLIALALVHRQSIGWALVMALTLWLAITALVAAVDPALRQPWRKAGFALLQAFPLLLTLFLLLPKLPPLWQMPATSRALSGLSETVSPGDISELANSSELAFRVTFAGDPPAASERYFPVMRQEYFDGRNWQLSAEVKAWQRTVPTREDVPGALSDVPLPAGSYEVIAEPQRHRWAFALASPLGLDGPVLLTPLATLYRQGRGEVAIRYRVSGLQAEQDVTPQSRQRNLQLPVAGNPRARAFALDLREQYPERDAMVAALLATFRREPYAYTLTPPPLGNHGVDEFLFDTRRGFCGHYAMATTFVLRSAGIPARLVTGYLGGEWNPSGNYLAVHQFDAHAWVEYLDEAGRWRRIDPTAVVAPERIEGGITQALNEEFTAADPLALQRYRNWALLNQLRWWGSNIDYQWSRWVLGHDASQLWQQLGQRWPALAGQIPWLILASLMLVTLLVSLPLLWPGRQPPQQRIWSPLLKRGRKIGCSPTPGESLALWCEHLAQQRPELVHPLQQSAWLYRRWRYAPLNARQRQRYWRQLRRRLNQVCRRWDRLT